MEKNLIKNILVLEGGYNEEHEVSISTASEVKKAIKELNYNLESILVNPINLVNFINPTQANLWFNG